MDRSSQPPTFGERIDERPLGRFQVFILVLCGIVMVLDGFNANSIGFLVPSISKTLQIPVKTFGPILASSLVGLMIAAMSVGPVADRWGRKWVIVFSTFTFAVFTILTAQATTFNELLAYRFLTGLGLGGAMPNAVALASEYSPRRLQRVTVAMLFAGMPLGAFLCGMASAAVLKEHGWQPVFYLGGLMPLALAIGLAFVLPESVQFLIVRGDNPRRISRILKRISDEPTRLPPRSPAPLAARDEGMPVKRLFTEGRAAGTLLLWIPFFMNLLTLYFVVSWLPGLLEQAGMPVLSGVRVTALFSFGGIIGCLTEGALMNIFGPFLLLVVEFGLSAALIGSLGFSSGSFLLTAALAFVLGVCVTGAQAGINALAATFYPTSIRSTGLGWALGVGRVGSIVGPLMAGVLLSLGWGTQHIFLASMIPTLLAMFAVVVSNRLRGAGRVYAAEPDAESA